MFQKVTAADFGQLTQLKASAARAIQRDILDQFPGLAPYKAEIFPNKTAFEHLKGPERASFYIINGEIVFFQLFKGPFLPVLSTVHRYPDAFPSMTMDSGAIRPVGIAGRDLKAAGFTQEGSVLPCDEAEAKDVYAVYAVGKKHACAVGMLERDGDEIRRERKGDCLRNLHCLGDGLWTNRVTK